MHLRTAVMLAAPAALASLLLAPPVGAVPPPPTPAGGVLDPTWDGDGRSSPFPIDVDETTDIALQPDGKAVVTLRSPGSEPGNFVLARFQPGGALDPSFGGEGIVATHHAPGPVTAGAFHTAMAVAVQPDGRIVAAGTTRVSGQNGRVAVVRYLADGALDPSFSDDGYTSSSFGTAAVIARDVVVQADGRIVAVGDTGAAVILVRYLPDGRVDPEFGVNGKVVVDLPGDDEQAEAVALDAAGDLVVVGSVSDDDTHGDQLIVRVRSNGSLDTSFGGDGILVLDVGGTVETARAVTVQPDGLILAAGWAGGSGYAHHAAVTRVLPDGVLDPTFGSHGTAEFSLRPGADNSDPGGIAVLGDGRIAVSGMAALPGTDTDVGLAVLTPAGVLDHDFDGDGVFNTAFGSTGAFDWAGPMAVQADGKLLLAGSAGPELYQGGTGGVIRVSTSAADVGVEIQSVQGPTAKNQPVTFTFIARNDGPADAAGTIVRIYPNVLIQSLTTRRGQCFFASTFCRLDAVASGEQVTVTVTAKAVPNADGGLFVTTQVWSDVADPRGDNNMVTAEFLTGCPVGAPECAAEA